MNYELPEKRGFTIYSKSGCPNCIKAKKMLKDKNIFFNVVDCDEYLIENKDNFLLFIKEKTNIECKMFPIIFNDDEFLGGYNELNNYIIKTFLFDENENNFK